jgi:hypothetical protein
MGNLGIYNKKRELEDWIRRKLGSPVLKAVPLAPEQIEDCIDEACDFAAAHMGNVATQEDLALIWVKPWNEDEPLLSSQDTRLIKNNDYLNNPTATTNVISAGVGSIMVYKQEYQLPRSVVAIGEILHGGGGRNPGANNAGSPDNEQSILDVAVKNAAYGGLGLGGIGGLGGGTTSLATASGLFTPSSQAGFGGFGTRGGQSPAGGGVDLISFTLGMQYLQMVHQLFTVKMRFQFNPATRKVRFSPAPPCGGLIIVGVVSRIENEWLYENLWIKKYALAKAKKQIAANLLLYDGATFPGGVKLNFEKYDSMADAEIEKLEKEIDDNKWNEPVQPFFIG